MRWIVVAILILLPNVTSGSVIIVEVMCKPESGASYEFVKIKNFGDSDIDINGWKINDGTVNRGISNDKNGANGDFIINPGESVIIAKDPELHSVSYDKYYAGISLSDKGDPVKLFDSNNTEINSIEYTENDVSKGAPCFIYDGSVNNSHVNTLTETNNVITTYKEVTRWETVEIQPPQDISIREMENKVILLGSELLIQPEVFDATGKSVESKCHVTFGDGSESSACNPTHLYEFIGKYIININAYTNFLKGNTRVSVTVINPDINILVSEDKTYVELMNNLDSDIELNGWKIKIDYKKFSIPRRTIIPAGGSIKISAKTMKIDINKYGGVAGLVNSFGKLVADSTSALTEPVVEQVEQLVQEAEHEEEAKEDVVESVGDSHNTITAHSSSSISSSSIVGTRVHINKQQGGDVTNLPVVEQVAASSTAGGSDSVDESDRRVVAQSGLGKWTVSLLAIIGIAIVPILIRKRVGKDSDDV